MEPTPPNQEDCCNSGCNPCILDVYEDQLKKYKKNQLSAPLNINYISLTTYASFKLIKVIQHTQNTFFYTFQALKVDGVRLIYKPGQHFLLKGSHDNKYFTKAYTPIPLREDDPLSFTILVKLYETGRMSTYLKNIKLNSETLWRGPYGHYDLEFNYRFMLFIAQGTGIAPLYAVICRMLENESCETFLKLFLCCRLGDLVLRNQLYSMTSFWNFTYEIFLPCAEFVRSNYNETINLFPLQLASLRAYFDKFQVSDVRVLVCGSDAFTNDTIKNLIKCGVQSAQIFQF
ncbi:hypothetical protein RN001_010295 [Aquatica leii]|uniref:FAD-binding FR-type domain-containing protein n=1 Tax=Aquatica leii TaxID=1421715 RepID=A0AAN7PUN2_9COLE|nr:hypothetical protein RN001_010295 [Aquatica leii]